MIIYQMKKPIKCYDTDCVGVTGDNIAYTQYFYIKDVSDDSISYTLHLRFADGSVNSITPDIVIPDGEGTEIRWIVKKNDIFMHGYFELQIEGRNKCGLVFQTEIVRLYADESLPVEDKEYANPNSETVKLREEAYAALEEIKKQQEQIEANVKLIEQTDLNNKADKATTLAGYGITDAYTKTQSNMLFGCHTSVTFDENFIPLTFVNNSALHPDDDFATGNEKIKYVFISSIVTTVNSGTFAGCTNLEGVIYGGEFSENIESRIFAPIRADVPTVQNFVSLNKSEISDYLIRAIMSVNEITKSINENKLPLCEKLENKVSDKSEIINSELNYPSVKYLNEYYYDFEDTNDLLAEKYDSSNIETGSGELTVYTPSAIESRLIKTCTFEYQKTGKVVSIFFNIVFNAGSINYLQFEGLPFKCNATSDRNKYLTVTNKNNQGAVYPLGSWLVVNFSTTKTFVQDEILKGVVTIQIS